MGNTKAVKLSPQRASAAFSIVGSKPIPPAKGSAIPTPAAMAIFWVK